MSNCVCLYLGHKKYWVLPGLPKKKERKKGRKKGGRKEVSNNSSPNFFPNGLCAYRIQILMSNYLVKFHIA